MLMKISLKQWIHIRSKRFAFGGICAIVAFGFSWFFYERPMAGLFFATLFILAGVFAIPKEAVPHSFLRFLYTIWVIITAFVVLALSQLCLNEALPDGGTYVIVGGVLLILLLVLLPFIITLRIRGTALLVSITLIVFTCFNYFVFCFRGSEIAPADILSITTAGNVASEYSFAVPSPMFYAVTLAAIYFFFSFALPGLTVEKKKKTRLLCCFIAIACGVFVWVGGLNTKPLHWLQTGSVQNGYLLNFTLQLRDSFVRKPAGYDSKKVETIANTIGKDKTVRESQPDIIIIMDESFVDFSVLGSKVNTDNEITPFIDSLKKDTLHGYALSSVFGGGTPNSEYEFLSGNTFAFLPTGSIAYQQFINQSSYSIVKELKSRGYSTIALHQYLPNSWMRERIWPFLGFEECMFLEDFPQKDLLRNWGTDQELFEKIAYEYKTRKECSDKPLFMFAVTIQNHGAYDYSESDFVSNIHLQGYNQAYNDVEQYLNCIHETDRAVQWLIEHFQKENRDVLVLFFGDHYPRLNPAFFEEVHGGPFETLNDQILQYEVPFFIWTNYQSEVGKVELTSMNYLADMMYQKAGIELPAYNQYLERVREIIPACNSLGYYSKSRNEFCEIEDAIGEERDKLHEYSMVEWNCMFDKNNRNRKLFPIG